MPQRGDNPNEVLFEVGSAWAWRNVDNYYDVDRSLCRPVDELLSSLEEQFDCPLVYLEYRRKNEATPHHMTHIHQQQHQQRMTSYDALIARYTEQARIDEFLNHDKEYTNDKSQSKETQPQHRQPRRRTNHRTGKCAA